MTTVAVPPSALLSSRAEDNGSTMTSASEDTNLAGNPPPRKNSSKNHYDDDVDFSQFQVDAETIAAPVETKDGHVHMEESPQSVEQVVTTITPKPKAPEEHALLESRLETLPEHSATGSDKEPTTAPESLSSTATATTTTDTTATEDANNESGGRFVSPKDFDLLKVIGMGAFGKVLQVRNRQNQSVLAMKVISKRVLKRKSGYVENVKAERDILTRVQSPFVVTMHCSFQTREKLFIIMDFLAGGELFLRIGREGIFLEKTAAFYLAEIILALDHLHTLGILHRDLKPENILLGSDGHVCLTDFGLAKDFGGFATEEDESRALTVCGTQEYMAPEMLARKGYGRAADYWSLGCIAYEMLSGLPPFQRKRNEGSKDLFRKIMQEKVKMPSGSSAEACKLLKGLLNRNVQARLGTARSTMFEMGGVASLKSQKFFDRIDWEKLERKEIEPPQILSVDNEHDLKHFHEEFTQMTLPRSVLEMNHEDFMPRRVESDLFRGFSFIQEDFELPQRDEDAIKTYWETKDEDGESVSDVASSKLDTTEEEAKTEPEKKKRPPRKRKKKKNEAASAESTPAPSAANSPVPSEKGENGDTSPKCDPVPDNLKSPELDKVEATDESPTEPAKSAMAPQTTSQSTPAAKIPQASASTPAKTTPTPAAKPQAKVESWQEVNTPKGTAPRPAASTRPSAAAPSFVPAGARKPGQPAWGTVSAGGKPAARPVARAGWGQSSQASAPPARGGWQQAPSRATGGGVSSRGGWQAAPAARATPPPPPSSQPKGYGLQRPSGLDRDVSDASAGSTDWRQHAMSPRTPRTIKKQNEPGGGGGVAWPSLGLESTARPKAKAFKAQPKPASPAAPPQKLQGAWAARK